MLCKFNQQEFFFSFYLIVFLSNTNKVVSIFFLSGFLDYFINMSDNPNERTPLSSGVKELFQEEHESLTSLNLDISWPYPAPREIFILWFSENNTRGKHISYNSEERRETNYVQVFFMD